MKLAKIITSLSLAFVLPLCAAQTDIEQWGVFEIALHGPTNGNPFLDMNFSARFTQGDSTVEANGFYDGDGVYRVRFMPEKQGEWHYVTKSSSAELNGQTEAFLVIKPSPQNHGPDYLTGNSAQRATSGSCRTRRCRSRR